MNGSSVGSVSAMKRTPSGQLPDTRATRAKGPVQPVSGRATVVEVSHWPVLRETGSPTCASQGPVGVSSCTVLGAGPAGAGGSAPSCTYANDTKR